MTSTEQQSDEAVAGREARVRQDLAFVYGVALRQVRDPHLAADLTQAVFLICLRKGMDPMNRPASRGWLHRTTCYVARNALKVRARRRRHEAAAARAEQTGAPAPATTSDDALAWSPLLDDALASLGERDRTALLLRYHDGVSLAQVGSAVGTTEDAARKRIARAVDKLRRYLARHGRGVVDADVTAALVPLPVVAPPALQAAILSLAPGGALPPAVAAILKGVGTMQAWTKGAMTAVFLAAVGTVAVVVSQVREPAAVTPPPAPAPARAPAAATVDGELWPMVDGGPTLRMDVVAEVAADDPDALRQEVFDAVSAAEGRLNRIHVDVAYRQERWDAAEGRWTFQGEGVRRVWHEAQTLRYRAEVDDELVKWHQGAAPFAQSQYIRIWDGQRALELHTREGVPGAPAHAGRGFVGSRALGIFWMWGWEHSIYGAADAMSDPTAERRFRLSAFFKPDVRDGVRPALRRVRLNGDPVVEVTLAGRRTLFIDLAHGAAIRGEVMQGPAGPVLASYVESLIEAGPEIYYPRIVHRLHRQRLPATGDVPERSELTRQRLEVRTAIGNPDDWPESLFEMDWPAEARVIDQDTGEPIDVRGDDAL